MNEPKTLTFALMDAPFESGRTAVAFRILSAALARGWSLNVFAYEGAVGLAFARQTAHANAVHGRNAEEEKHPLPREWIAALQRSAAAQGSSVDWVNCGLCVDERGMGECIPGVRRGTPVDFWNMASNSLNTLVIATR